MGKKSIEPQAVITIDKDKGTVTVTSTFAYTPEVVAEKDYVKENGESIPKGKVALIKLFAAPWAGIDAKVEGLDTKALQEFYGKENMNIRVKANAYISFPKSKSSREADKLPASLM